jgi:hypothetical protein
MRRGIAISAVAAAVLAAAGTPTAASAAGPRLVPGPDGVTIELVTANGSGCQNNTAGVALSDDAESFTVWYFNYVVQAGGSSAPTAARKNCQLALNVRAPKGYTYAVSATEHRGYASLLDGAKATQKSSRHFQGDLQTGNTSHSLNGPYDGEWDYRDTVPINQLVFKPCDEDRNLNIYTELRLDPGTSDPAQTNVIAMDPLEDPSGSTYHLSWKRCA